MQGLILYMSANHWLLHTKTRFVQKKLAQIARFVQKCANFLLILLKCGHTMAAVSYLLLTFAPA